MSEPIRQHTVPKCYLKNFATKRGKGWLVDVYDKKEKRHFPTSIANICVQSEFYTFSKLASDRQNILEKFYSNKVETEYPFIYRTLTDAAISRLEPLQRIKALAFVYSQYTRTSKLGSALNNGWSRMLEHGHGMINPHSKDQKIYNEDGTVLIDFAGRTLEDVQKEAALENKEMSNRKNFDNFLELNKRRLKDIIAVYRFPKDIPLITSDNPVESSKFMFDPESQFEMALDPNHLLLLLPAISLPGFDNREINRSEMFSNLAKLVALMYNCRQIDQAERYIIGKKTNLERALDDYINQEALLKELTGHYQKEH
ncbi:MAG: DUF4238 domain-containing protein [Pedobacter sp.]|nr:MAG: DUF4238 domain-containing protein [Pedobacter sp.]